MTNNYLLGFIGFSGVSQVLSAIIASERCFCILQPLRSQTVLRTSIMTAIIVAVNVVVVASYFLMLARYNVVCAYNSVTDSVVKTVVGSEFYLQHQKVLDVLITFVFGVGFPCVVMVVVTTTTTITAMKLRQAAAWRAGTSSSGSVSPREIALTRMLVFNSVFFIVCVFPIALFRSVCLVFDLFLNRKESLPLWLTRHRCSPCRLFSFTGLKVLHNINLFLSEGCLSFCDHNDYNYA